MRDPTNPLPDRLHGVYAIQNTRTGRCYVGSSWDVRGRWQLHRNQLRRNAHYNKRLQADWQAFGESAFALVVLADMSNTEKWPHDDRLRFREREWCGLLQSHGVALYNVRPVSRGRVGGRDRKPYTRKDTSR